MKSSLFFFTLLLLSFISFGVYAQDSTKSVNTQENKQHGIHFIDEDGDGYNDNAPDHDGDGIPNGLDPDWQKDKGKRKQVEKRPDISIPCCHNTAGQ